MTGFGSTLCFSSGVYVSEWGFADMGLILSTNDEVLGVEVRRESVNIVDLQRKYPSQHGGEYYRQTINVKSEHIFANADGEIEVSKEFLLKLIEFFEKPENRKRLKA